MIRSQAAERAEWVVVRGSQCSPLCGATKAYGRYARWWHHEPECPIRLAYRAAQRIAEGDKEGD